MSLLITEFPSVVVQEIEAQVAQVTTFIIKRTWQNLTISPAEGGTPRKTGFASASWIVSIGEPSNAVAGSKEAVDYSIGAASVETLRGYSLDQGAVFLVNNVPYIWRLNYGWSPQQTAGFVERAHQQALNDADAKFSVL